MGVLETLASIAEEHDGVVPAAAAHHAGIAWSALVKLTARGRLERLSRGVYRFPLYPTSRASHAQLHEALAFLSAGNGPTAVVSHETALQLRHLSDGLPAFIHLTIPPDVRLRRFLPKLYRIHRALLEAEEAEIIEGLHVTTLQRTILDVAAFGRSDLALSAIRDAVAQGYLTAADARKLRNTIAHPR
jgi:predicted transcriptional regulator of viral defense system